MVLEAGVRAELQRIRDGGETLPLLKRRCAAILMADQGLSTSDIARRIDANASQVSVWRRRFVDMGHEGLISPRLHAKLKRQSGSGMARNGTQRSAQVHRIRQRGAVAQVRLSAPQRQELLNWARAPLIENRLAQRARAVLQADDGFSAPEISNRIMMSSVQVLQWCQRYLDEGLEGLKDRPRSGRPARALGNTVQRIRELVRAGPPCGRSRWTGALLAETLGLSDHLVRKALKNGNIDLYTAGARPKLAASDLSEPQDGAWPESGRHGIA